MKNNDFEYIKQKFDSDGISAPDSLCGESIEKILPDKPKARLKFYQKKSFKAIVSAAACLTLIIGILSVPKLSTDDTQESASNGVLSTFESYEQIKNKVEKESEQGIFLYGVNEYKDSAAGEEISASNNFGETYVQTDGVDEGDILKNDGTYIYYVAENSIVKIYKDTRLVGEITDFKTYDYDPANEYVAEIYVNGNILTVLTCKTVYDDVVYGEHYGVGKDSTGIHFYDISDITSPKLIKSYYQSGSFFSSRVIDDNVYVVSQKLLYNCKGKEDYYVNLYQGEKEITLSADSIAYANGCDYPTYTVVSAYNTLNASEEDSCRIDTKAVYGCNSNIYCSKENLYLALYGNDNTEIVKINLAQSGIEITAKATVNGYVNNQFSMDERNDYFRIATTDGKANNLYVLDSNLNQVGQVTGFAKKEEIKAVKYVGDTAYVITYEETDPLFVIDLSNPRSPVIKGSVEITGFSSQLLSIDENTIFGIGYSDDGGIKLALFDVSAPESPKVLDSLVIENSWSNAQYNHRAICINRQQGYIAFDADFYDTDSGTDKSGAVVIKLEGKSISLTDKLIINPTEEFDYAQRVTYIGETLYVLDNAGNIHSFKI